MKPILWVLAILILISAVFVFTKPSDNDCIAKAKYLVNATAPGKTPGYEDPMNENLGTISSENIIIKDKFFWKKIDYVFKSRVQTLGYGYLGKFHPLSKTKNS